jgi:hypothetical protein
MSYNKDSRDRRGGARAVEGPKRPPRHLRSPVREYRSPLRSPAGIALLLALVPALPVAGGALPVPVPVSFDRPALLPLEEVAVSELPPVDVAALLIEDQNAREAGEIPFRVGYPMACDLDPGRDGTWEDLPGGGRVWRLRVRSPGALWIALGFGTWRLQPGGRMWVYDPGRRGVQGPFDSSEMRRHGQLWLPPVEGDTAVVELFWPEALRAVRPNIHLGTLSHGYRPLGRGGEPASAGDGAPARSPEITSGACNIDVNCPLGADWQLQKQGVARILIGGSGLCSGSLINTTAGDCRPYFLTARHCIANQSEAASAVFLFNYERPLCDSGEPSTTDTLSGSTLLADYFPSDFSLLELDQSPPEAYGTYFSGWNRSLSPASESTCIHHPDGDHKKISYNADPLIDGQNYGPDHWRVTEWEEGTTEDGSSGAPLFDQGQRIVGQLHGGTASCTSLTYDEFGKLASSWDGGGSSDSRLSDWLDPLSEGALAIDGIAHELCLDPRPILDYVSHTVQEILGNDDGIADPGEALFVRVDVTNRGNLEATQVAGQLSTATPLSGVSADEADWPDVGPGEQQSSDGPGFRVELDPALACGEPVDLTLDLVAAEPGAEWSYGLEIETGQSSVAELFGDDMESGANGWVSESLLGSESWVQVTSHSSSPTHSWYIVDTAQRKVTALHMPPLPALPAGAELRFQHRFDTEANRDGGVLEYSTDGGASWVDIAPLFVEGAYNSSIPVGESTPLAGRDVWSGDSGGWTAVRADLASLAGADLRLRWRFATNFSVGDDGWYVDDVAVSTTSHACTPSSLPPGEASDPAGSGSAFRIGKHPDGYELDWSAPIEGGAALGYLLYRGPLGVPVGDPQCEAVLGDSSPATLPALATNSGFLVVGRNSLGEGSYGQDSAGQERSPAQGPAICP